MSDTVKLIIEIDENTYKDIKKGKVYSSMRDVPQESVLAIAHGIPLDDVKAEIEKTKRFHIGTFEDDNPIDYGIVEGFDKAIAILDNIGKTESEEKTNDDNDTQS